jgi:hypothetical protein
MIITSPSLDANFILETSRGRTDDETCICIYGFGITQGTLLVLGLARTIHIYGVYTVFLAGKSPNKHTVIYGVCKRFWPNLLILLHNLQAC